MRRVVPRRIDHRIRVDRIHTFEHRPSRASPALLRRNAAWIAGGGSACPSSMGFSIDGCNVCEARISPRFFQEADCVLDCHQDALLHFRSWPGTSPTKAPRDGGSGTGLVLRAWRAFRFRRTAGSRISRAPRWRPHDSSTSSRGRASHPSRSIRIHRNARCEPKRCAAASPFLYRRPDCAAGVEARCGPNNSAMAMKTAPASARRFGIDCPPRGSCYSERITFQLRTSCSPPPALLTTGLPSVKYASSIASAHPAAIAFSRSASKSGRGV